MHVQEGLKQYVKHIETMFLRKSFFVPLILSNFAQKS